MVLGRLRRICKSAGGGIVVEGLSQTLKAEMSFPKENKLFLAFEIIEGGGSSYVPC